MNQVKKPKKPDPQLLKDLWSGNDLLVLKTLRKLRTEGNLTYMRDLLNLLNSTGNELIEKELIRFIADIKERGVVPIIAAGLEEPELKHARAGLLSAVWQSGLDYSRYLNLFVRLFIEGDYMVALESFTVIEQSLEHLNDQVIEHERRHLLDGLENISKEKKPLARELVNLLRT